MTFSMLIKQPWFQILVGVVLVIILGISIYYWGKSNGRSAAATEFDNRQSELLKKSQDAVARADQAAARALNAETYAEKLKEQIGKDRQTALRNEERISEVYRQEEEAISQKYDQKKNEILSDDVSACDRCHDLCRSTNALAAYGPEFANYKCDAATDCALACTTRDP